MLKPTIDTKEELVELRKMIVSVIKGLSKSIIADEDLISVGMVGYAKAVETFDATKGTQFSTWFFTKCRSEIELEIRRRKPHNNMVDISELEFVLEAKNDEANEKALVDQLISKLKEKEQKFIIHRFGLYGNPKLDLNEIGEMFGYTKANASLVEKQILKKLRVLPLAEKFALQEN